MCAAALLAVASLVLARLIGERGARRREAMRRRLLPALMSGRLDGIETSALARKTAAALTLELAELVRGSAREGFIAAATAAGAPQELARLLRSRATQDRLVAAEGLAMFPDHADAIGRLVFADPNPDVRLGAALALAHEGRAPPVGKLVRGLGIGKGEHSLLAISLMRDLVRSDRHAVEALLYDIELPDAAKLAATDALAASGAADYVPLVTWMAEAAGDDPDLYPRVLRALGQIGHPAGHPAILAALDDTDWRARAAAAEAAGRSALRKAVPRIAELLDDEEWWVRFRAGEALTRLGSAGRLALHRAAIADAPIARAAAKDTLAERRAT